MVAALCVATFGGGISRSFAEGIDIAFFVIEATNGGAEANIISAEEVSPDTSGVQWFELVATDLPVNQVSFSTTTISPVTFTFNSVSGSFVLLNSDQGFSSFSASLASANGFLEGSISATSGVFASYSGGELVNLVGHDTAFSAVPEPSTSSALAGLAGLAFAATRRRKT